MIAKIKLWSQNIIIAVVISIIIEMILPEGNNKKYVKVITGLYILYIITNPILELTTDQGLNEIKNIVSENEVELTSSEIDIATTYILSLQNALKALIQENGYDVENVVMFVTEDYSNVVKIEIKMKAGSIYDEDKIRELVKTNYEISNENIIFN